MNDKICRLCLQTISGSCQPVGRSLKDAFELNMDISKDAVKCSECAINLEVFLKFKSACDYIGEMTLPPDIKDDIKLDPEKIDITDNLIPPEESKHEAKCCFCTKTCEREFLTSLNESKEHTFLVDVLKEHIPKLNLSITEELLTCDTCIDAMQDVVSFLTKCLDVEQKISKYTEIKGTDDNGQIELKNVQQFVFESAVKMEMEFKGENELEESYGQFPEECATEPEDEIKHKQETEDPEMFIKTEDIDIKSEASDCDSFQEHSSITKIEDEDISVLKSQREDKERDNEHDLTYKNSDGKKMYKCEICPYVAKLKSYVRRHELVHKTNSEVPMFRCEMCTYQTKRKYTLNVHARIHKSSSEVTMFKCQLCPYETKVNYVLKQHSLTHVSLWELKKFKCEFCSYITEHESCLKRHALRHRDPADIVMLKCELCPYETKQRGHLNQHALIHKSTLELTMFKCELCPFETKRRQSLSRHKLTHKNAL